MRVAIVGAGIVGVTTAHELSAGGHEVVVLERRGSVASEASFAQGGIVAPGWAGEPFAGLSPWRLAAGVPSRWGWLAAALHSRSTRRLPPQRLALQRLAKASRQRLLELTHAHDIDFEQADGVLVLLRHERAIKAHRAWLARMADQGLAFELVDADRARQIEPALNPAAPLRAAIHLPQDVVGNGRQFAHRLKAEAVRRGARFRFDTEVVALRPGASPTLQLADGSSHEADAVVLCTGADAPRLLAAAGLRLPLRPVWGVSVTAPVNHVDGQLPHAPRAAVVDPAGGATIARVGQRVRVAGGQTMGGDAGTEPPLAALRALYRVLDEWFPGSAVLRDAVHWRGARPLLPDGLPLIGASALSGVWLNLGHGGQGWALACGSAQLLAQALDGREADPALAPLSPQRLR
ncbi:MAG: FAD-dependent oxidoreductase [Betaproteobacteria bacterium]